MRLLIAGFLVQVQTGEHTEPQVSGLESLFGGPVGGRTAADAADRALDMAGWTRPMAQTAQGSSAAVLAGAVTCGAGGLLPVISTGRVPV